MATRTSVRPRPVDHNRQLAIVRDITELDTTEGLLPKDFDPSTADPGALAAALAAAGAGAVALPAGHVKKPKHKEIPVPEVKDIPTYTRDYLPVFHIPHTYLRGKGGTGYVHEDSVEYDLDNDDEDWLEVFNKGSDNRLNDLKFERMLWRLELAWAEATDAATTASERMAPATLGSTSTLPKPQGLNVLRKAVGGREAILEAVYDYWASKRKKWGKPMLRRLQAPTAPGDTNPYNVFRVREKSNRPLTRRRRENSTECIEKLRQIRESLIRSLQLAELVLLRERKKADLQQVELTVQRLQLALQHQQPDLHAAVQQQASTKLRELQTRSGLADPRITSFVDAQEGGNLSGLDVSVHRALLRKRRRLEVDMLSSLAVPVSDALNKLPPPIMPSEDQPLWSYQPNILDGKLHGFPPPQPPGIPAPPPQPSPAALLIPPEVAIAATEGFVQPYIGRCGRVVLARCDPLTLEPFSHFPVTAAEEAEGALTHAPLPLPAPSAPPATPAAANGSAAGSTKATPDAATVPTTIPVLGLPPVPSEVSDADALAFHSGTPEPWAFAFDVNMIPDFIDKTPIIAARKRWLHLQDKQGKATVGTFHQPPLPLREALELQHQKHQQQQEQQQQQSAAAAAPIPPPPPPQPEPSAAQTAHMPNWAATPAVGSRLMVVSPLKSLATASMLMPMAPPVANGHVGHGQHHHKGPGALPAKGSKPRTSKG